MNTRHQHLDTSGIQAGRAPRVVIVGGGIAGLAAAYRLKKLLDAAPQPVPLILLESDDRLGGKILTERVDGFVIEGGPDTFLAYKPRGVGLCRELGLGDRLHGTNEKIRRTYVMRAGRLHTLPEGLTGLIPSRFGPMALTDLISPWGKLRMGWEYFVPPRRDEADESLAEFVERRLGREVYDRLIEPLLSGIYAGDGAQLSLGATFPQLRQAEQQNGSLVKSMLAARRSAAAASNGAPRPSGARSAFLTPRAGLAEIVEALEAQLAPVEVRRRATVAGLRPEPGGYRLRLASGETLWAEAVILATPGFVTAELVAGFEPEMAQALRGIPYTSTATVSLAYPLSAIPRPLDGYGYVIPKAEGRAILACTWTSTKFPHRAPEGYGLIRAFIGRAGADDVVARPDTDLLALAQAEVREVLGVTAAPTLSRVFRWPQAMPQYTLGHLDRVRTVERCLAGRPGLWVAGNAYSGIGLPDCIASGEKAAEAAGAYLRALAPAARPMPG